MTDRKPHDPVPSPEKQGTLIDKSEDPARDKDHDGSLNPERDDQPVDPDDISTAIDDEPAYPKPTEPPLGPDEVPTR